MQLIIRDASTGETNANSLTVSFTVEVLGCVNVELEENPIGNESIVY